LFLDIKYFRLNVPWNRDILEVFTKRKVAVCCIVGIAFGVVLVGLAIALILSSSSCYIVATCSIGNHKRDKELGNSSLLFMDVTVAFHFQKSFFFPSKKEKSLTNSTHTQIFKNSKFLHFNQIAVGLLLYRYSYIYKFPSE